ncbi:MAG: YidH family protein, partial [Chloroflexota bacterium]
VSPVSSRKNLPLKGREGWAPVPNEDDDRISRVRQHLANERTLLSWTRLSLAIIALGFVVARFGLFLAELFALSSARTVETGWSVPIGVALVLAGPTFAVLALWRFLTLESEIEVGHPRPHNGLIYTLVVATVFIGAGLAVYLVVVAAEVTRH